MKIRLYFHGTDFFSECAINRGREFTYCIRTWDIVAETTTGQKDEMGEKTSATQKSGCVFELHDNETLYTRYVPVILKELQLCRHQQKQPRYLAKHFRSLCLLLSL